MTRYGAWKNAGYPAAVSLASEMVACVHILRVAAGRLEPVNAGKTPVWRTHFCIEGHMVNEKNDTVSVEDYASDNPDNAASSVLQTEQEIKTAGMKSRSKPRVSRKKKLSPETASSDNGDARADIPASETATLPAVAPLAPPEAACDGVAASQNTAEPEQNK